VHEIIQGIHNVVLFQEWETFSGTLCSTRVGISEVFLFGEVIGYPAHASILFNVHHVFFKIPFPGLETLKSQNLPFSNDLKTWQK